jgi:hypothetical protein
MNEALEDGRRLLRHAVATLAYRGGKAVRGAPAEFGSFRAAEGGRRPVEIVAHVGDVLAWALGIAQGRHVWEPAPPGPWETEVERFFAALRRFDDFLAGPEPLGASPERIFQGPVADALTHVGQLALLRRLAGAPVRGENYFKAEIAAGRVGPDQPPPVFEFD